MKINVFLLFLLMSTSLFAQLKVRETGQVLLGTPMTVSDNPKYPALDVDTMANMIVYGPNGNARARGRIAFGDLIAKVCYNVLIGEYGETDSDQLWLHGKMGTFFTSTSEAHRVWGSYNPSLGNYFQFNCDVRSTGVFVASDAAFKENITPVKSTLENIKKINAVTYKLKYDKLIHDNSTQGKSMLTKSSGTQSQSRSSMSSKSEKEINDERFNQEFERALANQPDRIGFIAQEVEKIFPELVHKDSITGYMYVDYLGMIPIAINAIKELEQKINMQTNTIEELKLRLNAIEKKLGATAGNAKRSTIE